MPLVEQAGLPFLSDEEAGCLLDASEPEDVLRAVEALRAETVVVHGAGGAFAVKSGDVVETAAYPVETVDTVGAGDAFVAGFLSGRLMGWDAGGCLELANACGACAVTVPGDAESMPFEEEALALVRGASGVER